MSKSLNPMNCSTPGSSNHRIFQARVLEWVAITFFPSTHSVQFSHSIVPDSLGPHELQHARPPCPSSTLGVHSSSCPLSQWWHPARGCSVVLFCFRSALVFSNESTLRMRWPKYSSFSFSIIPSKNTQDWSPLEWIGLISLQSKGLSRVFSNTTVQKHQFLGAQLSSQSNSCIHTWPLEKP